MKNRRQWRSWLQKNHDCQDEVWLVYYKKHTNKPSIPYVDAVEEAICFGWIDGKVRSVDAERYMQRYTPRRERSNWSELNIGRARRMIAQGQMTEAGLSVFRTAMKTNARVPSSRSFSVPHYLKQALLRNMAAWENFQRISSSAQLAFVYWVESARTDRTRQARITQTIHLLEANKKLGEK